MATGTIKKVVADRGFGFIAADDAKEYFFHRGGLDSSLDFDRLMGGEKVNFEIQAPASGVLARVLAPVNTPVLPGTAIAEIET